MPHLQLHTNNPPSPTLFATIPPSPIPALKSPSTCFSDDHYTGTSSPPSELQLFRFVIAANTDSTTGSPTSAVKFSCKSVTLYWYLFLSFSAASHFRFFSLSVCHSFISNGSSPTAAANCPSNSVCSLLYCTYLLGYVLSYLWVHCILWRWQVWGVAWCYMRWNSGLML